MREIPKVVTSSSETNTDAVYENHPIARVNGHGVRLSVMTEPYHWHVHPDSDETFLCVEGMLEIEFDEDAVQPRPDEFLTVPKVVRHRPGSIGERVMNLTLEDASATSQCDD